jgi:hypothetical protein
MTMLRTLATSMLVGAVQKRVEVAPVGPVSTALLTTGASLMLRRGRRPIGLALLAAGGLLLWHEAGRRPTPTLPPPEPEDGSATRPA